MRIYVEAEQLMAVIKTLEDIPKAPPIEQWGLMFACYNTLKAAHAEGMRHEEGEQGQPIAANPVESSPTGGYYRGD